MIRRTILSSCLAVASLSTTAHALDPQQPCTDSKQPFALRIRQVAHLDWRLDTVSYPAGIVIIEVAITNCTGKTIGFAQSPGVVIAGSNFHLSIEPETGQPQPKTWAQIRAENTPTNSRPPLRGGSFYLAPIEPGETIIRGINLNEVYKLQTGRYKLTIGRGDEESKTIIYAPSIDVEIDQLPQDH